MARSLVLCHVTTAHPRRDPRIFLKECVSLAEAGHSVHLVVGDGLGDDIVDAVSIHDVGAKPTSRLRRMWLQPRRAAKAVQAIGPDVVHFHDPELLPMGLRLARSGLRVIYDSHEDVGSQIRTKHWIPRPFRHAVSVAFSSFEQRSIDRLAGVVAATPHIADQFKWLGNRVVCINNYALPDELAQPAEESHRQKRVCYVGAIGTLRGIRQLIQALPLVPAVRLTLCGLFSESGLETAMRAEPGWAQVDYRGFVDRETVRGVMAESIAGVVNYLPAPNHVDAQPTKLFEYMSAALPVVASDFPSWRRLIEETGAGVCVDPESPVAIAQGIRAVLERPDAAERMGQAGRDAVLTRYNWSLEAAKLLTFYEKIT